MFKTIKNCAHKDCSKERKYLNLASDAIFTDFYYESKPSFVKTF